MTEAEAYVRAQLRVVGYFDETDDSCYHHGCRPANWRELLVLFPADIPEVDDTDEPPLCKSCGHYL